MHREDFSEDETQEKAIARLGIASFVIDISIIGLVFAFFLPSIRSLPLYQFVGRENLALAEASTPVLFFAVVLFLYFQVSEYFGVNASLGRWISGLNLLDVNTQKKPEINARRNRIKKQIKTLGLPTLNPNRIASYNRAEECCINSDWLGVPVKGYAKSGQEGHTSNQKRDNSTTNKTHGRPEGIVSVIAGAVSGQTVNLDDVLSRKQIFVIGRAKGVDLRMESDKSVSNRHCHIKRHKLDYIIQDGMPNEKGSSFGTKVNGQSVPFDKYMRLPRKAKIHLSDSTVLEFL